MKTILAAVTAFCLTVTGAATAQNLGAANEYRWTQAKSDQDQLILWKSKQQLGVWSITRQKYWPMQANGWGQAVAPPVSPPAWAVREVDSPAEPILNFGIVREAMRRENTDMSAAPRERIEISGQPVDRIAFHRSLSRGAPTIPDDKAKYRLIFTGTAEERKAFDDAFKAAKELDGLRDKIIVDNLSPDYWSLFDNVSGKALYPMQGGRTCCVLTPAVEGKASILYFEPEYKPGDFKAIRKAIDRNEGGKTYPGRTPAAAGVHPSIYSGLAVAGAAAGVYVRRRRKN